MNSSLHPFFLYLRFFKKALAAIVKFIVCKSWGELFLFIQCTTCTFGSADPYKTLLDWLGRSYNDSCTLTNYSALVTYVVWDCQHKSISISGLADQSKSHIIFFKKPTAGLYFKDFGYCKQSVKHVNGLMRTTTIHHGILALGLIW